MRKDTKFLKKHYLLPRCQVKVVFDSYPQGPTTKDSIYLRRTRQACIKIRVADDTLLDITKQQYFSNSENKQSFVDYVSLKLDGVEGIECVNARDDVDCLIVDTAIVALTNSSNKRITVVGDDNEWSYLMRREMQEIIPGLFLGPYSAAVKSKTLEANLIRPKFPDKFKYLILDIKDSVTEIIIPIFPKVKEFLDDCFACGGRALVHGNSGISRSGALIIGYVMESLNLTYREAISLVQQRRFCVNPNAGFVNQLKEYEPIYKARKMLQNGHQSQESSRNKRPIHML
ncbi:Serine/threonine/tyrosine-interacting protein [Nymphon striatum]|nr:Serine/threonine/tyrosine-interacting protein [Nymphon striatum]